MEETAMARRHKVAVYGTLMAGERNGQWAADALDRRPCILRGTLYDTGRGYPAFVPDANGSNVRAECLTVTQAMLERLDGLEGYPWLFSHRRITVTFEDGKTAEAITYVMNGLPDGSTVIASGDWRASRRGH